MSESVSIVILNWNGKKDTLECLDSVYKLSYPAFQVYLVDNGSDDGCVEEVRKHFHQATIIVHPKNTGFCRGNNSAIAQIVSNPSCRYVLFLNNDTTVDPLLLSELVGVMRDPGIGSVSPVISQYHNPQQWYFCGTKVDWANGDLFGQYRAEDLFGQQNTLPIDFTTWCAMLTRNDILKRIGSLDERFFAYYEDIDWSIRCRKRGFSNVLYPKVLVRHKGSQSTGGGYSALSYYYVFRNRLLLIRKHASLLRKAQFSRNYIADAYRQSQQLSSQGKKEHADAILDGIWSALHEQWHDRRLVMPEEVKNTLAREWKPLAIKTAKTVFRKDRDL